MLKFAECKEKYINTLRHGQNAADTTCVGYQSHLNHYQRYLEAEGHEDVDVEYALSVDALETYQFSLSKRGLRPRSIKGKFDPIRGMIKYLIRRKVLVESPLDLLTFGNLGAAERLTVSKSEVEALWAACLKQYAPRDVALSRAVFAALCGLGVRAAECAAMQVGDINFEAGTVLIPKGKGDKARELTMPPECVVAFRAWGAEREKMNCQHDGFWAYGPRRGISADKLRELLEKIKAIAGFRGAANIKPHSLRHYFATNMMRNGASVKQIQVALGHANLKQTATYLHLDEQDARAMAVYASFAPDPEETNGAIATVGCRSATKAGKQFSAGGILPLPPTKSEPVRRFRKASRSRILVR